VVEARAGKLGLDEKAGADVGGELGGGESAAVGGDD
jgi:hypothetical protein